MKTKIEYKINYEVDLDTSTEKSIQDTIDVLEIIIDDLYAIEENSSDQFDYNGHTAYEYSDCRTVLCDMIGMLD